jgi:hypothetical protein
MALSKNVLCTEELLFFPLITGCHYSFQKIRCSEKPNFSLLSIRNYNNVVTPDAFVDLPLNTIQIQYSTIQYKYNKYNTIQIQHNTSNPVFSLRSRLSQLEQFLSNVSLEITYRNFQKFQAFQAEQQMCVVKINIDMVSFFITSRTS